MTFTIDGTVRVVGCHGIEHPTGCTAKLERVDGAPAVDEQVPYHWAFHIDRSGPRSASSYHQLSEAEKKFVGDFLEEHGVAPVSRFMPGASITVRVRCDGVLMVHTWRAVLEDGATVACPTCPCCLKQERVMVPLAGPVPDVAGALVSRSTPWLPTLRDAASVPGVVFTPPTGISPLIDAAALRQADVLARSTRPR